MGEWIINNWPLFTQNYASQNEQTGTTKTIKDRKCDRARQNMHFMSSKVQMLSKLISSLRWDNDCRGRKSTSVVLTALFLDLGGVATCLLSRRENAKVTCRFVPFPPL